MIYKRVSFYLTTIFTGILCLFAILLSTPWGTQLTLYFVDDISPIQVKYRSGAFLKDLQLSHLTINNEQMEVNATDIRLTLNLRCLWKNQVCIDELSLASLQVSLNENSATSSDQLIEEIIIPPIFTLPFSVKVKQFYLASAQIKNPNLQVKLTDFSSILEINDAALTIEKFSLAAAHITLVKSDTIPANTTKTAWPLASLPKVYLPFKFNVKSFTVKELIVNELITTGDEETLVHIEDAVARLSWFKTKLTIDTLSSNIQKMGSFSLKGKLDFVPPYNVDITVLDTIKDNEIVPELNDSRQQTLLQGNLSHLAITVSSEGTLALTADAKIDLTDANLPYELTTQVTQYTLPSDITQVITPAMFVLQSQGDLNQQTIEFNSEFSGFGYQNVAIELSANLQKDLLKINTFYLKDFNADNELNLVGELQLGDKLSWDINLDTSGFTLPNIDKRLSGRVQGNIASKGFWHGDEWALSLENSKLTGQINNIKLLAEANIDLNHQGKLAPSKIFVDYGDIALNLNGYSDENWHVNGQINVDSASLWLKDIESSLRSTIDISGPIQDPEITLQGEIEKLVMANFSSDAIHFNAAYRPLNNHEHKVAFTSMLMNLNQHTIKEVSFSSNGDLAQQQINLAWLGDSSLNLSLDSQYSPTDEQLTIQAANTIFSLGEQVFKSSQPIHLLYNNKLNTLAINQHCWLGSLSQLCLNDNTVLNLTKGDLTVALQLDTALLKPFIPEEFRFDNTINGNISIGWQPDATPSIDAQLLINAGLLQINKENELHKLLEWEQGQLNLQMNDNSIKGNMTLSTAVDNTELLNASTSISLTDNSIKDSHITINNFNLSPIQVFVPELSSLEGMLNTNITVNGMLDKPIINGEMKLTDGKIKIASNMNTLENINMAFDFKGQQAIVSGGVDVNKVTANLTGDADWQNELQGNFNLDGEAISFSVPPDLALTISPHLNAQINASELKLSGRIEVLKGKLAINKLPQGSVSLSKDVIIVNDDGEQVTLEKPFNILTNVRVVIADAFQIEGQGFVGRLGGELQVSQQPQQPLQLFGSLKIPEGRYRAYGQDLSITKGNISFNGPANTPYVSMQATRSIEKEDIIVGIDAKGLANSLHITLFSKPTMQQSEALSYLVRGRGLDAKTNNSNAAIGVALGTAITNFSGVLTQIEKLPLLNKLEIDGDDEQASIAGYLGDQVYVKYGVGVTEPIKELTVRFYIYSRLWVEAVSGLENSANIYYSFDIK